MYIIEAEGLSKTYGDGEIRFEALHVLGGIEQPTSGRVLLEDRDISLMSDDDRTRLRRQQIGFIFQAFNLMPTLTAEENVLLPLELGGALTPDLHRRAAENWKWLECCNGASMCRASSREGNYNEWQSPGRWLLSPPFCWPMNPPVISIAPTAGRLSPCCANLSTGMVKQS